MNFLSLRKKTLLVSAVFFFLLTGSAFAASPKETLNFNVDKNYDASARSQIPATLVKTTSSLYFYVETSWWDAQTPGKKSEILADLDAVSLEFGNNIYPKLTSVYGSEWKPGVDGDNKITILFESINSNLGGYFRSQDEYIKLQSPDSNEREMLYLPIAQIDSSQLKVFLAHEFVHLIVFNQKDRLQGVSEEVWLSEARSDYASTILGYDDLYQGSNLQRKVQDFLVQPSNSLTEWQNIKYDYSAESLFTHYLVDHYGIGVLANSLKSKLVGIPSLNEILLKNGAKEDFSQIFTDWTVAVVFNDCSASLRYCYLNQNLTNLKINPTLNFLPIVGNSSLSVTNITKNWSGNWQKIIGGNGNLSLQFSSLAGLDFKVPYIIFDKDNHSSIKFLTLDKNEKGQIDIKNFGTQYTSLIIIPSLQTKVSGFEGLELTYPYTFTVSITGSVPEEDRLLIQKLLAQIDSLKKQIAAILQSGNSGGHGNAVCAQISSNLYLGVSNKEQVSCLQQFLASEGSDIYPEGFVTGNFGPLTTMAVIRFQEKYPSDILTPVGLSKGTGFVGTLTRQKINQLLAP